MTYQPDDSDLRVRHLTEVAIQSINDLMVADVTVAAFVLDTYLADTLEEGFRASYEVGQALSEADVGAMSLLELRSTLTAVLKRLKPYPLDRQHQSLLKIMLMKVWDGLDQKSRKSFMQRLDENANFVKPSEGMKIDDPVIKKMDLEEILHMWPSVYAGQEDGWERDFAKDVLTKRNWRNWKPSPKQQKIIRKMYVDWMRDLSMSKEVLE